MTSSAAHTLLVVLLATVWTACARCGREGSSGPGGESSLPGVPDAAQAPVGTLEAVTGSTTLLHGSQRGPLQGRGPVYEGDEIETGADGAALLTFDHGVALELGPDGRYRIERDAAGHVLRVDRGFVVSRRAAAPTPGGPQAGSVTLSILTPFGLTRVGLGDVELNVSEAGATVQVKLGEIVLVGPDGTQLTLQAGEAAELTKAGLARRVELAPIQVVLQALGRVDRRAKDAKAFAPIDPRRPPSLAAGDALRVRDGRAVLRLGESEASVTLLRGAEAQLGAAVGSRTETELGLPLTKGSVALAVPASSRQRVLLTEDLSLSADASTSALVTKTRGGYEVRTDSGKVTVARTGAAPQVIWGGQLAALTGERVDVRDLPRQSFAVPTRPGAVVYHPGLSDMSLSWDAKGEGPYRVTVSNDPKLEKPLIDGFVKTPYVNVKPPAVGRLYWKVEQPSEEPRTGSATFGREPRRSQLARPRNEVPEGPDRTTIFFQDKPPAVTFTWVADPAVATDRYRVAVYVEGKLGKAIVEREVKASPLILPDGTLEEGRYVWSVTPLSARGAPLKGGRMNSLEIAFDNAVGSLVILEPKDGDRAGPSIPVRGIAPVGSRLLVNGRAVPLDEKARFSASVPPLPGGRVVFQTVRGGRDTYTIRVLR